MSKQTYKFGRLNKLVCLAIGVIVLIVIFTNQTKAAFNPQMNYQGRLMTTANVSVADGTYNMEFKLYTASTGGTAIWTETRTTTNRVQVTNGLFSVMLGSVTSLTGVDFNQTLYLGVNIGGTASSPTWDGEMTPRKSLGAVPAAFVAQTLNGYADTAFPRKAENATVTGNWLFSNSITATGLANNGNVTLNQTSTGTSSTQYPSYDLVLQGSGWNTTTVAAATLGQTFRTATGSGTSGNIPYRTGILNNSGTEYVSFDGLNQRVGIGITSPSYKLDVSGGTGIVAQFSGRVIGGDAVNAKEFPP